MSAVTCHDCGGAGSVPTLFGPDAYEKCPTCRGTRTVFEVRPLSADTSLALFPAADPCGTADLFPE